PSASFGAALDARNLIDDLAVSAEKASEGRPTAASSTDSSGGRNDSSPSADTAPRWLPRPPAFASDPGGYHWLMATLFFTIQPAREQAAEKRYINPDYAAQTSAASAGDGKASVECADVPLSASEAADAGDERPNPTATCKGTCPDDDSDLENDEGGLHSVGVPGLATTKEMEVRNPLFKEDEDVEAAASASSATAAAASQSSSWASNPSPRTSTRSIWEASAGLASGSSRDRAASIWMGLGVEHVSAGPDSAGASRCLNRVYRQCERPCAGSGRTPPPTYGSETAVSPSHSLNGIQHINAHLQHSWIASGPMQIVDTLNELRPQWIGLSAWHRLRLWHAVELWQRD
uniref:Pecanex_C domain-containing protein n=1 Tax=Macrostomum lignano TaxID=282301 RepID=A0A1I8JN90_9PLAT